LPRELCEALGVKPGDKLALQLSGGKLVIEAQRARAMEALQAIRQAFAASGIPLEEFLESGRHIREELFREKYGDAVKGNTGRDHRPAKRRRRA
jgi:hypothetical protein